MVAAPDVRAVQYFGKRNGVQHGKTSFRRKPA
jgi:hypothetical protein